MEPNYQKIAEEIMKMAEEDQEKTAKGERRNELDIRHTNRMKEIVAEIGWPTISKVGKNASFDAWLLVQHADHDIEFQKQCLELMYQAGDDVEKRNIAYLEDRVRVNENRPQLYGTQFFGNEEGKYIPRPIENIEHLDERRKEFNLEPFSEYEAKINKRK